MITVTVVMFPSGCKVAMTVKVTDSTGILNPSTDGIITLTKISPSPLSVGSMDTTTGVCGAPEREQAMRRPVQFLTTIISLSIFSWSIDTAYKDILYVNNVFHQQTSAECYNGSHCKLQCHTVE